MCGGLTSIDLLMKTAQYAYLHRMVGGRGRAARRHCKLLPLHLHCTFYTAPTAHDAPHPTPHPATNFQNFST